MKVNIIDVLVVDDSFVPFSIKIDIANRDELYALTKAAGKMCNGHGLQLYDLLIRKCKEFEKP